MSRRLLLIPVQPRENALKIPSPCVRQCFLDETRHCRGCGRSLDEIARWSEMSSQERHQVLSRLAQREAGKKGVA